MTQIHQLVTRREETSKETIAILEDFLEMAKRGELNAVAICGISPDGTTIHQANSTEVALLGAVGRLLHVMYVNS